MRAKPIRLAVPLLVVILVIFASWQLGLLKASEIKVNQSGISCVTDQVILQEIDIKGQYYWQINQQSLSLKLASQYPCIQSVVLDYQFPNQLVIRVQNRQPIASVVGYTPTNQLIFDDQEATPSSSSANLNWEFPNLDSGELVTDNRGKIFTVPDRSWLPQLFVDQNITNGDDLEDSIFNKFAQVIKKLPEIGVITSRFKLQGEWVLADSRPKLIFSLASDVERQLASLQLILSKTKIDQREIESIDLRFNKPVVVYVPKK